MLKEYHCQESASGNVSPPEPLRSCPLIVRELPDQTSSSQQGARLMSCEMLKVLPVVSWPEN